MHLRLPRLAFLALSIAAPDAFAQTTSAPPSPDYANSLVWLYDVRSLSLPYLPRRRQRTISYSDCCYRVAISHYADYPGFRVGNAAIRAAKG